MKFGYYNKNLKTHEVWIPIVLFATILVSLLPMIIRTSFTETSLRVLGFITTFLCIAFLFPWVFYLLDVDLGNFKNCLLWLLPLATLAFGYNVWGTSAYSNISWMPIGLFIYYHSMRILHFKVTDQSPSFVGTRYEVGSRDKFSNRLISNGDISFNVLYSLIPIAAFIGIVFYISIAK